MPWQAPRILGKRPPWSCCLLWHALCAEASHGKIRNVSQGEILKNAKRLLSSFKKYRAHYQLLSGPGRLDVLYTPLPSHVSSRPVSSSLTPSLTCYRP